MRHRVYGRHLGRDRNQRTALFKSLVQSLLLHEAIQTTQAKAKAIKGLIDKLITGAKNSRFDLLEKVITNKSVSEKLISDLVPRLQNRTSGYTSTIRLGQRKGDRAMMVRMSLLTSEKTKIQKELGGKSSTLRLRPEGNLELSVKSKNIQKKRRI